MRYNLAMRRLLSLDLPQSVLMGGLPRDLRGLIEAGWYESDCGAVLLAGVGRHAKSWPCADGDVAGREYEINDVRIPHRDFDVARDVFLPSVYARTRSFAESALRGAGGFPNSDTMTALIRVGVDDDYLMQGAGVRFFTLRGGYPDWINDLDGFNLEALMVISVTDID